MMGLLYISACVINLRMDNNKKSMTYVRAAFDNQKLTSQRSLPILLTWYRGSPDSTNFVLPGNRTIAKIVLSGG